MEQYIDECLVLDPDPRVASHNSDGVEVESGGFELFRYGVKELILKARYRNALIKTNSGIVTEQREGSGAQIRDEGVAEIDVAEC
jgi:hypothetical protein